MTLEPPFRGTDRPELFRRIAQDEPTPPRKLEPRIPVDLETIVLKAMAKDPADRYSTAADLAEDLGRFLDDQPIRARSPSFLGRAAKWTRRRRKLMAATGIMGLLVAIMLAVAGFHYTLALEMEADRANRNAVIANRNRRLADRHLHAAQLRLASAAIETGQIERGQDILHDEAKHVGEDDPRDFAWHVLWERATRRSPPYTVTSGT